MSPEGKHVASLFIQYTPYECEWKNEKFREKFSKNVFSLINEYCPGFSDSVVGYELLSPLDLEETFSLTGGNIFHGSMSLNQIYFMRSLPGFSNYRSPIKNLFVCGASQHPVKKKIYI